MKKILGIMLLAFVCSVQTMAQQKITQEFKNAQARVADGVAKVYVKPIVAKVELVNNKQRIEKTYPLTPAQVEGMGGSVENIRAYAAYMASKEEKCDIILSPLYMIDKESSKDTFYVTIIGYPAQFVGWDEVTNDDWTWINERKDKEIIHQNVVKSKN